MTNVKTRSFWRHPMAWFALFVGFLFVLWFAGWFAFASYADRKLEEGIESIAQRGTEIDCQNRAIRGFPFRIGVHCDALNISQNNDALKIELGEVRTAAQLYAPGNLVAEIDSPFRIWPGGQEITANWSGLRFFLDLNFASGFDLASVGLSGFNSTVQEATTKIETGALHFRPTPEDEQLGIGAFQSLDGALNLKGLSIKAPKLSLPPATIDIDGTLVDGYRDLIKNQMPFDVAMRDGAEYRIRNLTLALPEGGLLAFAGPLLIDPNGLVTGKVDVGVSNPQAIAQWAGQINPRLTGIVDGIGQAVAVLGQRKLFGSEELRSITITIEQGKMRAGFITLGNIPPLFRN